MRGWDEKDTSLCAVGHHDIFVKYFLCVYRLCVMNCPVNNNKLEIHIFSIPFQTSQEKTKFQTSSIMHGLIDLNDYVIISLIFAA